MRGDEVETTPNPSDWGLYSLHVNRTEEDNHDHNYEPELGFR
jgi:hypothetical protein